MADPFDRPKTCPECGRPVTEEDSAVGRVVKCAPCGLTYLTAHQMELVGAWVKPSGKPAASEGGE